MKKVQIATETPDVNTIQMTEFDILFLIQENGLEYVLSNYELPEEFILKHGPSDSEFGGLDKRIVMNIMALSQDFIYSALTTEYLLIEDISQLNMRTYSNLDPKFIDEFSEYINWERMILYLSSSEKLDNIDEIEWLIEKFNLWHLISANELPVDFIRKNKQKFDWRILSIVNCFSDDEKLEFEEFIPKLGEIEISDIKTPNLKEIRKIIKAQITKVTTEPTEKTRFEVKHTTERLTRDDLMRIKQTIQDAETRRNN